MKAHLTIVAGAALLMGAAASPASVLLYGWNGTDDGWTSNTAGTIIGTTPARGITEGTGAMEFVAGTHQNYGTHLASATDSSTILDALAGRTKISFDAIMVATGYTGFQNWGFSLYVGGKNSQGGNFGDRATFVAADSSGTYASGNRVNSNQATLVFDYSALANGDLTAGTAQSVYFQIETGSAGGLDESAPGAKNLAVDNFQVLGTVPEPASLGLIGLSGLLLTARKRRSA